MRIQRFKHRATGLAFLAAFLAAILAQPVLAQEAPAAPALVAPAVADWNAPVDFGALREQYGARDDYDQLCDDSQLTQAMAQAVNQAKDDEVLRLSERRLAVCPVDIAAHLYRGGALRRLGRADQGALHIRWARGLLDSIAASGDGKTEATAYRTVSVREEYEMLGYLRLKMRSQSLVRSPARDRIEAVDAKGETQVVYFYPKAHFLRLAKRLGEPMPKLD